MSSTPRLLVTNGGPHSATDLALVTAEAITELDPDIAEDRRLAAMRLRLDLADKLALHHAKNQAQERERIEQGQTNGPDLHEALAAMHSINDATNATPFAEHYRKPEVQAVIREIVQQHFVHAQEIERDWHLKRNS